jgi:hypothetical protein
MPPLPRMHPTTPSSLSSSKDRKRYKTCLLSQFSIHRLRFHGFLYFRWSLEVCGCMPTCMRLLLSLGKMFGVAYVNPSWCQRSWLVNFNFFVWIGFEPTDTTSNSFDAGQSHCDRRRRIREILMGIMNSVGFKRLSYILDECVIPSIALTKRGLNLLITYLVDLRRKLVEFKKKNQLE